MTSSGAIKSPPLAASKIARKTGDIPISAPAPEESDETLMARVCNGDRQAFACLFRRYARVVRSVGCKVLRDDSEADDLLQEVFLCVFRKCKLFNGAKGTVYSWIMQITYRRAIDRRRRLATRHFYTSVDLDSDALDILDPNTDVARCSPSIEDRIGKANLLKMFEALSENQRETLRLYFFEGCTFEEIATKLGQKNVRNHFYRGLDRLRTEICGKARRNQ